MKHHILPIHVDKGTGTPVVLLHGLGNNYKSWTFVLRHMKSRTMRIVAPDLLGFGTAPKPAHCQYTPADHAEAVINTLDMLKVKNAVIAGHSMGCIVAIEVAKRRPDLVKRLVLLGAPLFKSEPQHMTGLKRFFIPENGYFTLFSFLKENPDFTITGAQAADAALPMLKGMQITEQTWPAFKQSLRHTIMQFQSYQDVVSLQIPTTLFCGILDFFVIRANLKQIAAENPQYVTFRTSLGPHEITPLEGKRIAKYLTKALL